METQQTKYRNFTITKTKPMKKTHNNTVMICLTIGLLTGSLLAGLMINKDWFFVSTIFGLTFGIFYTSHGEETINPRTKNTFKKK